MISIKDKEFCCGCSACASVCPRHCIAMQEDDEGFIYPIVNSSTCVDCGLCEDVCHELHPYGERKPLGVYAAINRNEATRMKSSSGGIFYLLAEKTIAAGGVVFGARFDEQWQVVIDYAETLAAVKAFMGSKYVQARIETAYTDAKRFLKEGRKVLFSGTPCQIAGLHHFLGKEYPNLTTVDVICHGVPSPKVWRKYLPELVGTSSEILNINFRDKFYGWSNYNISIKYKRENVVEEIRSQATQNIFMRAFLGDLITRTSCHSCRAKNGRSHSDITLGDFWGIENVFPDLNDDRGTSIVILHTDKGRKCVEGMGLQFQETTLDVLERYNPSYMHSAPKHPKRDVFFARLDKERVIKLIEDCTKLSLKQKIRLALRRCKSVVKKEIIK